MPIYLSFILKGYLKSFLMIFLALEFFVVGIDLLSNLASIPSANLQLLYAVFKSAEMMKYTLPISLLFAMLSFFLGLIKSNELVALHALGVSKREMITPVFIVSLAITLFLVLLSATDFARVSDYAHNIKKHHMLTNTSSNFFMRYNNQYIFFTSLEPLNKSALEVYVYTTKDHQLIQSVHAPKAIYLKNHWELIDATITTYPQNNVYGGKGFETTTQKRYETLVGFEPEILKSSFSSRVSSSFTLIEAINGITLFKEQDLETFKLESRLYLITIFPFFAPFGILILFYFLSPLARYSHLGVLSIVYVFITLLLWGLLYMLNQLAFNGFLSPRYATILPIFLLVSLALYLTYGKIKLKNHAS